MGNLLEFEFDYDHLTRKSLEEKKGAGGEIPGRDWVVAALQG
jgi:hypothetical protein